MRCFRILMFGLLLGLFLPQALPAQVAVEMTPPVLADQIPADNSFLSEDSASTLSFLNQSLNGEVERQAEWSFESLRRPAFLGLHQTMLKEFLSFQATRQSS